MLNISKKFKHNDYDAKFCDELLKFEKTPEAMKYFMANHDGLTNYGYWFFLSTIWVSYSGWIDIEHWREAFSSSRGDRRLSIMKPDELKTFDSLPTMLTLYRAHRDGEKDFIAMTLDPATASNMAISRGVDKITEYRIHKKYCIALFLRRGEFEIITMHGDKVKKTRDIGVRMAEDQKTVLMVRIDQGDGG